VRKRSLRKEEREVQIINWFAIRIQHDNEDYATMYQIARGLGLTPSSHITSILKGMVEKGALEEKSLSKSGRFETTKGYRLKSGTFQRPAKQTIRMNFTVKGIKQMELL